MRIRRRWLVVLQLSTMVAALEETGRRTHAATRVASAMAQGGRFVERVVRKAWSAVSPTRVTASR